MEDREIIKLFLARSEDAIKETENKFSSYLHTLSYRILLDYEDAKECVSDTYLNAWNDIPPTVPMDFKAYLSKITRNISISRLRMRQSKKRGGEYAFIPISELEECIASKEGGEKIDEKCLSGILNDFLKDLSEEKRIIFLRRYWYCYSIKEIAKQLHVKEKSVNNTLYQVRIKLKEFLESRGYEV